MKRITLIGLLIVGFIAILATVVAFQTGEKSPIYVAGTIELPEQFKPDLEGITTMFVTVFDEDSPMPMPYGAMRERLPAEAATSYGFALTKEKMQIMRPDAPLPKYMRVKVRFDKDGLGGPDQPGDLVGSKEHVSFGTSGLLITIQQKI